MAGRPKDELIEEAGTLVRRMQTAQDLFDDAAAQRLGVNRTDLRVLDVLGLEGPLTAGRLAELNNLSRPATTAAIDRLERAGYAERDRSSADRREVTVRLTPLLQERAEAIWGPIGEQARVELSRFTAAELELVAAFLRRSLQMSEHHLARVMALDDS